MELSQGLPIRQKSKFPQATDPLPARRAVYQQLPVDKSRTRVLVLHSHSSDAAPVSCSLKVVTLDPEPSSAYTALSYVWGDASVTEDINVNGVPFAVTFNLVSALRQIRNSFGEVVLWADAICMRSGGTTSNPVSDLTCSYQSKRCSGAYSTDCTHEEYNSKAERVIGWLGPDENGGSQALKTFETLLRTAIRYPDDFEWVRKIPEILMVNGTFTENGIQYESNHKLENLLPWLRSPFWRRIWIVQELVLPLSLRLMCGEEFMDVPNPDSFYRTVNRLAKLPNGRPESVPLQIWMKIVAGMAFLRLIAARRLRHSRRDDVVDRIWEGAAGFMNARVQLEFHQTSDPRDHVYGLLGLFDLDIVPDYGEDMTVGDVYLEVARCCLKTEFRDILTLAGTRHSCSGSDCWTHLDSPSWVPDWRLATPARIRLDRYPKSHAFPSDGGLQMQIIDYKWLRGSAVVWDTVSKTEFKVGWDLTEWDLAERIDIEKPGDRAYPSGITRFQAFIILWHGGYDGSKAVRCDLQPGSELFRSYEVIFYANIAKPWTNKHGLSERPKLVHHVIGGNDLRFRATSIPKDHRESYLARSRQLRYGMRCFHTEKGYIGFGPLTTEVGQLICVLEGHKAPVLLERSDSHYLFVGDCDVVGIMNGEVLEAVKRGEAEMTDIEIR